jgi:hypothetical protein
MAAPAASAPAAEPLTKEQMDDTLQMARASTAQVLDENGNVIGSAWRFMEHRYALLMQEAHASHAIRFFEMKPPLPPVDLPVAEQTTMKITIQRRVKWYIASESEQARTRRVIPIGNHLALVFFTADADCALFEALREDPDRFFPMFFTFDEERAIPYTPYLSNANEQTQNMTAAQFVMPAASDMVFCFLAETWIIHPTLESVDVRLYPHGCLVTDKNCDTVGLITSDGTMHMLTLALRTAMAKACMQVNPSLYTQTQVAKYYAL